MQALLAQLSLEGLRMISQALKDLLREILADLCYLRTKSGIKARVSHVSIIWRVRDGSKSHIYNAWKLLNNPSEN